MIDARGDVGRSFCDGSVLRPDCSTPEVRSEVDGVATTKATPGRPTFSMTSQGAVDGSRPGADDRREIGSKTVFHEIQ